MILVATGDLVVNLDQKTVEVAGARVHLIGSLLLLMLLCGWLYAGTSGAVITTVLGAIALMLVVRKVSPLFVPCLSGCLP